MRSRRLRLGLVLACIAVLSWGGWVVLDQRRIYQELGIAKHELAAGRYSTARERLTALTHDWRIGDEAFYQLGLCEESKGRFGAALAAWEHVASTSPFALRATIARARILANSGRLTQAEELISSVPWRQVPEAKQVRQALELLLRIEGRTDEVLSLILETWEGSSDPAGVLRRLYLLDNSAFPVDYVRGLLNSSDPNDDRVGLAKANLAIWTGKFDEASRWLVQCLKRRPDDESLWRARLELAIAADDLGGFSEASSHLSSRFADREVLRFRAWVAARTGKTDLERRSLIALLDDEPGNIGAWDRLAELSQDAGQSNEAAGFRAQKAKLNKARERYKTLISRDDRAEYASELEELAQQLGQRLEARGWGLIRQGAVGTTPLVDPSEKAAANRKPGESLATLLADLLPHAGVPSSPMIFAAGTPVVSFADDAESAGLRFVHDNGNSSMRNPPPPEPMCGGVALIDFDGDHWLDVYAVQGGPFPRVAKSSQAGGPDGSGRRATTGDRLFRNRGDGTFEDVTERSGIGSFLRGYGHGVAAGDYNNDGFPDLFVTRWRSYALYHNRGDGTFEDVTEQSGLAGDRDWPTSAAFADLDGDGDLDLYVCHYLRYDPSKPKRCEHPESPSRHDCNPLDFPALPDHVFRNDGGRFVDVTASAGFVDPDGRGLGVVAADLDDDGLIDLYVANDMSANYLFHNLGGFKFEEVGQISGTAASSDGGFKAGMGIASGDLDGDGRVDFAVTNYFGESTTFYRNLGHGFFADHSAAVGLSAPTRGLLGFGISFLDVNNDGWLDVLSANGHVLDARPSFPMAMPLQLLLGGPTGRLKDVSATAGAAFSSLHLGRGLAVGDIDNDGRQDAVVVAQNEPLVYLHNETSPTGHFVRFQLEGTRSNRDAIGARITVTCAGRKLVAQRVGGSSYQSSGDPRIHFGLGGCIQLDAVEVRWPSGHIDRHANLLADRQYQLREGSRSPSPLSFPGH